MVVGYGSEDDCADRYAMHTHCRRDDIPFWGYLVAEMVDYGVVVFLPLSHCGWTVRGVTDLPYTLISMLVDHWL